MNTIHHFQKRAIPCFNILWKVAPTLGCELVNQEKGGCVIQVTARDRAIAIAQSGREKAIDVSPFPDIVSR